MFSEFARSVSSGEHIRRRELLHPDRADALTEGVVDRRLAADTSVMCRVPRLCLTPDQKSRSSGDGVSALPTRFAGTWFPQRVSSLQACLWSVPRRVSRRGSSVPQHTFLVAFERCPLVWTSRVCDVCLSCRLCHEDAPSRLLVRHRFCIQHAD